MRTDAGNRDDVEAMIDAAVDQWGGLDILVNNAWGGGMGTVEYNSSKEALRAATRTAAREWPRPGSLPM